MFLKRLDLVGFKSFAPRTSTELLPGISVVVGPNGSGKSNIADAVRWVLGEQSAKAVRARKPEEVIFAGSAARQPMGMAEVSLILDNAESGLPIEFSEVRVTRRLYRSGDSEYLLNGARVRLRDISQLLLHAGISPDGYAVIGQGSVDELILQRPDERRVAFENAADIRRHQLRLNDTRNKLAATEANLVRVQDVLAELGPHVRRLKSQAERAERAEGFQSELRTLLVRWFRERLHRARQAELSARGQLAEATAAAHQAEAVSQAAEESVRSLDDALRVLDEQLAVLRPRVDGFREQARSAERGLAVTRERAAGLAAQRATAISDTDRLHAQLELLRTEATETAVEARPRPESEDDERALGEARARAAAFEDDLARLGHEREYISAQRNSAESRLTDAEAQLRRTEDHLRSLESQLALAEARSGDRATRLTHLQQRCAVLEAEHAQLAGRIDSARTGLEDAVQRRHRAAEQVDQLTQAAQVARQRLDRLQGALTALGAADGDAHATGAVAPHLTGVLDGLPVLGVAAELAQRVRAIDGILRGYLERVVVLADDATAREAYQRLDAAIGADGPAWAVLSATGLLLSAHGERAIAAAETDGRSALIDWRHEVEQTRRDLEDALKAAESSDAAVQEARHALQAAEAHERSARGIVSELEAQVAQIARTQRALTQESHQIEAEARRAQHASARNAETRATAQNRVQALREAVTAAQKQRDEQAIALRTAEGRLAEVNRAANVARAELVGLESAAMQRRAQHEARAALHARIAADVDSTRAAEHATRSRAQQLSAQIDELAERESQLVIEIERTLHELVPMEEELATAEQRRVEIVAQRRGIEERLADLRGEERAAHASREQRHVEAQRAADEVERLHVEIAETAELEGADALMEQLRLDLPEARSADHEELDLDAARRRIGVLQRELRAVGGVADSVVAEYRELRERHDFLTHQSADLRAAIVELEQAAAELEAHMRDQFAAVFAAVDAAFVECFKVLFGGGDARLVLTNPDDLLTSGIDIVARPPGKKLQGLLSLSGGERALTVVALLFGLLEVNPTPFCVLDEVDAALDEANVQRFANLLSDFAQRIQFIVVTHNRATMEKADVMYGVSMDANGVSHVYSVRPRTAAEQSTARSAVSS